MSLRLAQKFQERDKIGKVLVNLGFITQEVFDATLAKANNLHELVGQVLVKEGYITYWQLASALAVQFKIDFLDLEFFTPTPEAIQCLPEAVARQYTAMPISIENGVLTVAFHDPLNALNISKIARIAKYEIVVKVSPEDQLKKAIEQAYSQSKGLDHIVKELTGGEDGPKKQKIVPIAITERTQPKNTASSIETLVNTMIEQAATHRASDIHVEPDESVVRVRERVDGILREVSQFPKDLLSAVISRLKILGGLDIAERRNAQDGRFRFQMENNYIDLRLSTLPTVRGEKAVLRILDKSALSLKLEELGMNDVHSRKLSQVLEFPHGIILVTGPTGSGKSTTVYSMLNRLNTVERNIITVEDPVEYQFHMINQVQIQPKAGVTFAGVLRNILRQDPDVIMVGEIRDKETAEIAIRAALTGHLVISTLHTNDSISTIGRLIDMGIEPFLLSSSLLAVVSQRLVRLLCPSCRELTKITEIEAMQLGSPKVTAQSSLYGPKGCQRCLNTGYKGRQPIFEILAPDLKIRKAITDGKSPDEIRSLLKGSDFTTLREDGVAKMLQAKTSLAEVLKATVNSD